MKRPCLLDSSFENDAVRAATALETNGCLVGHDPKAFARLGAADVNHQMG